MPDIQGMPTMYFPIRERGAFLRFCCCGLHLKPDICFYGEIFIPLYGIKR